MIKIFIIIFLSIILECNLSNYILINTNFFNNFLTVTSLIIISDMIKDKNRFYFLVIILASFYDLIFTNRFGFSLISFFILAIFIKNIDKIFKTHIKIIKYIIIFILYRIICYLILLLIGYLKFDFFVLLKSIYSSIIINLIYAFFLDYLFLRNHK